jgi:hypothetical protein
MVERCDATGLRVGLSEAKMASAMRILGRSLA